MNTPLLQIRNIIKGYAGTTVLRDISFDVNAGEIVCLLGPSGCGKSTLLSVIAGLVKPDSGVVFVNGDDISAVPVHRRDFGFMFQELALFPHKNVYENVAFGLRMARQSLKQIKARVSEVLALVGLSGFDQRNVSELSGGEQQRVALARSLAPHPRLLMLDEPLSSLDRALRERLMDELRDILKRVGQTAIYVTHDQQEAFSIADRIVIMNQGRIAQVGTAQIINQHPANTFVARFLGYTNLLSGHVDPRNPHQVATALGVLNLSNEACQPGEVTVLIRPEAAAQEGKGNPIDGQLLELTFRGRYSRVTVRAANLTLNFDIDSSDALPPIGSAIHLVLNPAAMTCLPQAG